MLYFIEAPYNGKARKNGAVKVGYTNMTAEQRLMQLQCGNPHGLRIIAVCPGTQEDEADLHERMVSWRIRGEWYAHNSVMRAVIRRAEKMDWLADGTV